MKINKIENKKYSNYMFLHKKNVMHYIPYIRSIFL